MYGIKNVRKQVVLVIALLIGVSATAQVPDTLSYQGFLSDSVGQALVDPVVIEFSIYTVETGGVPIWSEFQDVFPAQGLFSTTFGNGANPLPVDMFDTPLYLGLKVSVDPEMTPRTPLTAAAYSHKAKDAETVNGFSANDLDQSNEVSTLTSNLSATESTVGQLLTDVGAVQSGVAQVQGDLATTQNDLATTQSNVGDAESDISILQTDLANTVSDLTVVENTLPNLQNRVTGTCASGSAIRTINSSGTVICETDDASLWLTNGINSYLTGGGRVGIGTSAPAASIQIDSPVDVDPFRARVASSTKLRVHSNGSVSVGTSTAGTDNGLYVGGDTGLGTNSPTTRLSITDIDWQMLVSNNNTGGGNWYVGSSADAWAAGGGKFLIGPSTSSSAAALAIDSTKNVGIGTTAPDTKLHLTGGSDVNAVSGGYLTIGFTTGSHLAMDNNEIMGRNNGSASILALNAEGGEVTINSGGTRDNDSLKVVGKVDFDNGGNSGMRITATTSNPTNALFEPTLYEEGYVGSSPRPFWRMYSREFYARTAIDYKTYSDRSLKSNIEPIGNALDLITSLEGVRYALNEYPMDDQHRTPTAKEQFVNDNQVGFIAQDVEKVLPQLVSEDTDSGLKTVAYMGVIPVLVEALKQQQQQIDALKMQLEKRN